MTILLIGSGGREAAITKTLLRTSPAVTKIYAIPGNGGLSLIPKVECRPDIGAKDIDKIVSFATANKVDFAVVAPDDPLVLGAVDALEEAGVPAFGPTRAAARIEGSKAFAKDLMKKYGIPTAAYEVFDKVENALRYVQTCKIPIVVKADGLALGKGVTVAMSREEALSAVRSVMEDKAFGESGNKVVVEEYMTGPEVSLLCFADGKTAVPMVSSTDHKRAHDGDKGPNTGGMGTVAPSPYYTFETAERTLREIINPTIAAMAAEGCPFKGCLYAGLMITPTGPRVIEFNCRFGDPETQVVLPLFDGDLLEVLRACRDGALDSVKGKFGFSDKSAAFVVAASDGYPIAYKSGFSLAIPDDTEHDTVFVAGAKIDATGNLVTAGGRVAGVAAVRDTLEEAIAASYEGVEKIGFANKYYRRDIGKSAVEYIKKNKKGKL